MFTDAIIEVSCKLQMNKSTLKTYVATGKDGSED